MSMGQEDKPVDRRKVKEWAHKVMNGRAIERGRARHKSTTAFMCRPKSQTLSMGLLLNVLGQTDILTSHQAENFL